jgi:hypothetical protein
VQHGMSIGIGDTVADAATGHKISTIIDDAKTAVKGIIEDYQNCKLEGMPGRTLMEAFEQKVNGVLNKARDDAGAAVSRAAYSGCWSRSGRKEVHVCVCVLRVEAGREGSVGSALMRCCVFFCVDLNCVLCVSTQQHKAFCRIA